MERRKTGDISPFLNQEENNLVDGENVPRTYRAFLGEGILFYFVCYT